MTSIAGLQQAYRDGTTSPVEVAQTFLDADPTGPPWGAFCAIDPDDVHAQARASADRLADGVPAGPLEGVPVAIKDFLAVAGYRTYAGTRDLVAHGDVDSAVAARLRAAGALLVGKTHTTELGLSPTGINHTRGTPVNPHSRRHLTGGSSSGTAAAVAAGLVPAGVGSDGGGSIRIPAALCGVFGIKPSWQLVPTEGEVSVGWWSIEHVGPLATSTADLATMLSVMVGRPFELSSAPLRWGVDWTWWGEPDPEVDADCRAVAAELAAQPVRIDHVQLAAVAGYATALSELAAGIWRVWQDEPDRLGVDVRAALAMVPTISGADYVRAQQVRRLLAEAFDRVFGEVDVLVVPTTATAAPLRPTDAELDGGIVDMDMVEAMTRYTFPANLCGLPAASVPVGTTVDGRPIGLQLIGRRGADDQVLSACAALERAGLAATSRPPGAHDPHPPVPAGTVAGSAGTSPLPPDPRSP